MPASSCSFFTRRRRSKSSRSAGQVDAARTQAVGDLEREGARDGRSAHTQRLARPRVQLVADLVPALARAEELVVAELLHGVDFEAVELPHAGKLERADHDVPAAVSLHVEERIRDGQRDLVAQLG